MHKLLVLLIGVLLSGCVEKKIKKDFDNNIKEFNDFYHSAKQDLDDPLIVFSSGEEENVECNRANIKANEITLKELVKLLSKLYNININYAADISANAAPAPHKVNDKEVDGNQKVLVETSSINKISLNMADVCVDDVFDNLTEIYNIGVEKGEYGYVVYPKQLKTETFTVDYHNFYRKGRSSISIANSQLKEQQDKDKDSYSSISTESIETFWASITKTIRTILSADKERKLLPTQNEADQNLEDFYVYKENGLVVVTAYPRQLKYIKKFLSQVNNSSTKQVLIEAKILEVELSDEFSNGIQWDLLRQKLYYSSFASLNATIPNIRDIHATNNLSTESDLISSVVSAKSPTKNNFNIVMQALASQGKISVISSSRIVALNNQRALIKSGEDKYFVTNVTNLTVDAANSNNTTSKSGFDLAPFFSGIALDTTPHIVNNKEVLLHIHPMISRVNDENKLITIDNKDTRIPVAMIQSREADTVAKAHSGDIIILGGMTQNFVKLNETGLPFREQSFFARVFSFFSAKKHRSSKVELIILLKPTIINHGFNNREDIGAYKL